ncbi:unnamed protein product, partial [Vitis vinifera]|uniref:Uncharacterized protein n=1 Tax=Vitis vinifera TaxID=29760 RepID=D7T3V3_VITVI
MKAFKSWRRVFRKRNDGFDRIEVCKENQDLIR